MFSVDCGNKRKNGKLLNEKKPTEIALQQIKLISHCYSFENAKVSISQEID